MTDSIRAAIQAALNACGDGWACAQYTVVMGLERITAEGTIESTAWMWSPPEQADWMTAGLLDAAMDMRERAELDD